MFVTIIAAIVMVFCLVLGMATVGAVATGVVKGVRHVVRKPATLYTLVGVTVWGGWLAAVAYGFMR